MSLVLHRPALFCALLLSVLARGAGAQDLELVNKPVIGKNADGHLEVFTVGSEGQLRHRFQKLPTGSWSAWSSLGGTLLPGIALATNALGELEVFAVERTNHALCFIRQTSPNGQDWSEWSPLGVSMCPPVAVGTDADGRLEVFGLDARGSGMKHLWQTDGEHWSGAAEMGGNFLPGPVVARERDGRLALFAVEAGTGHLRCCRQLHRVQSSGWSEWSNLGGSVLPGFAVGQNILGLMEVFAVNGTTNGIERICQAAPGDAHWTSWSNFSSELRAESSRNPTDRDFLARDASAVSFRTGLAVGQSADGRLEVLAVSARDNLLLHRWETKCDGSDLWAPWASLGKAAEPWPAVVSNEDGDLEVFAMDVRNREVLNHRRQISRASDWLDWSSLDQPLFQYTSRTWQTDEGLPHNLVQAIAQTRDGYLWVGTREGLARFDGLSFTTFNARNTPALRSSSIAALCADRSGALWIGTEGGGVACLRNGRFSSFSRTNGLAGDTVHAIHEGRDGTLWIGTTTGLSRYRKGEFANFTKANGLFSSLVRAVFEDRDSNLWIATGAGLDRLSGEVMDPFVMPNSLPNDSVRAICQDQGGRIWIGSNNGMLWYNWFWTKSFYAYNTLYGLSDTFVSAICEDAEGNLWVGTYSGLNRFREGRFFSQRDNEGQPFGKVNALLADREGDLWVGSNEGLVRLTPQRFTTYTKQQGLAHNNVTSVLEDHAGRIWAGTWGGGLARLEDERFTAYTTTNQLSQNLVLALCEGRDGGLWVGADYNGGLLRIKDGRTNRYTWKDGLLDAGIRVLHEDRAGSLWIGTSQGLCRFKDGAFMVYTGKENLAGEAIRAICEEPSGALWFGTDNGLHRFQDGRFTRFTTADGLPDNAIRALYLDKEHALWIGTGNGGLSRYRGGRFANYTAQQGLFSDEVFEILEDNQGWLWLSCSRGVFRVNKKDLDDLDSGARDSVASVTYGKSDGMETPQCSGAAKPAAWKSRDGRLWFATTKGLTVVDPLTVKLDAVPPPVYIQEIMADRKPMLLPAAQRQNDAGGGALLEGGIWNGDAPPQPLALPPGRGELEFHCTALTLPAPEATRFKFKLEGIDSEWKDAGTRRVAYYNNVPPGSYRFSVIAGNKDGVWNAVGASVAIAVAPHWWQRWSLRIAMVALVLGGASGSARYVTKRRMQRKLELLERRHAVERERGRIAKDIHDDLGSSLTRIMMLGERVADGLDKREEVGAHVQKIVSSARHTVQALDEIVWAVNPENDSLEGLVEYLSHYADEFFENTAVSCRLEIPARLPAFTLAAELRHDLFLVAKEAFNNIVKHSRAGHVMVQITAPAGRLEVRIEDDGCGLDPKRGANGRKGNGLENMRRRIELHGGAFSLQSAPGQGTKLQFTLPLAPARSLN